MDVNSLLEKYSFYLKKAKWKINASYWILISIVFAFLAFAVSYFSFTLFGLDLGLVLPFVIGLSVADLMVGYPYLIAQRRFAEIEEAFPDALKQMADILKAGGSYDYSLREISKSEYGPLKEEVLGVLRRLEEGQNIRHAMMYLPENVDSVVIKRSVSIITDAIEVGAPLSEILEDIANDSRENIRIRSERKALTLMQVLFIVSASAVIAPFVLGIVLSVGGFMVDTGIAFGTLSDDVIQNALGFKSLLNNLFQAYLAIMIIFSSLMVSVMREGNVTKALTYMPFFLLIGFSIFFISYVIVGASVLGM